MFDSTQIGPLYKQLREEPQECLHNVLSWHSLYRENDFHIFFYFFLQITKKVKYDRFGNKLKSNYKENLSNFVKLSDLLRIIYFE